MFNKVADIAQYYMYLVNSKTFKDLWNEIQGLSRTCPVSSTFEALNLGEKNSSIFKDFQGCVGTLIIIIIIRFHSPSVCVAAAVVDDILCQSVNPSTPSHQTKTLHFCPVAEELLMMMTMVRQESQTVNDDKTQYQ